MLIIIMGEIILLAIYTILISDLIRTRLFPLMITILKEIVEFIIKVNNGITVSGSTISTSVLNLYKKGECIMTICHLSIKKIK